KQKLHKQSHAAKMVSAGEVDFETFQKAIEANIAGAALKSGNTTEGAFANMGAAMGRFGATLIQDVFPVAKLVFNGITTFFDNAGGKIAPFAEGFAGVITGKVVPAATALIGKASELTAKIRELIASPSTQQLKTDTMDRLRSIFDKVAQAARNLGPAIKDIVGSLSKASATIGVSTWQLLLVTVDALATVTNAVLVPAIQALAKLMKEHQGTVTTLVGAYTAWKVAALGIKAARSAMAAYQSVLLAVRSAQQAYAFTTYGMAAAEGKLTLAQKAGVVAAKAQAAATWLLNAAMSANPITLIVIAIVALVAAFVIAYKKSQTFRNLVQGALKAVGDAAMWLWNSAIKPAFDAVAGAAVWLWTNGIKPMWDGITTAFNAIAEVVSWWWNSVLSPIFSVVFSL
ncbi:hypothetical protein ACMZ42_27200, partial [Lysinibacillus sp. NPDC056185]